MSVCRRYSTDKSQAMDYFQDAMVRIYRKMNSFKFCDEGSLFRWMSRVAVNLILDSLRIKERWLCIELDEGKTGSSFDLEYADSVKVPEEVMLGMIEKLSPAKRIVFNLSAIEGYSFKQIGSLLGVSEDGASSTMSKARKELSAMVKDYLKQNEE